MDFIWKNFDRRNSSSVSQLGQSTVEYVLLFAVVTSIALTILRSSKFNQLFGENGQIATSYRNQLEFSYRHGLSGSGTSTNPNYKSGTHETYNGRFFSAKDGYPR